MTTIVYYIIDLLNCFMLRFKGRKIEFLCILLTNLAARLDELRRRCRSS